MITLSQSQLSVLSLEDIRIYLERAHIAEMTFVFDHNTPDFVYSIYTSVFDSPAGKPAKATAIGITFILRFWPYLKQLSCKNANGFLVLDKQAESVRLMDKDLFDECYNLDHWVCSAPFYENKHLQINTVRFSYESRFILLHSLYLRDQGAYCKIVLQRESRPWLNTEMDWFESAITRYLAKENSDVYLAPFDSVMIALLSCFLDCIYDLTIGSKEKPLYVQHDYENGYLLCQNSVSK